MERKTTTALTIIEERAGGGLQPKADDIQNNLESQVRLGLRCECVHKVFKDTIDLKGLLTVLDAVVHAQVQLKSRSALDGEEGMLPLLTLLMVTKPLRMNDAPGPVSLPSG